MSAASGALLIAGGILFGAVLVKTNVLLVLPNKLAELGAVYDCLH